VTNGWKITALGAINDKNQILALGTKADGQLHFLLIQIRE
jgi:hypothetical protein